MEASNQQRHEEERIECWDDDEDLQCADGIQFRAGSAATSVTGSSVRRGRRDSISSRRSARSDLDSNFGDEDWQVLLHDNDETTTQEAIASAKSAGIPIPDNVPKSALVGGTIKRLGGWKTKKPSIDDWTEDIELSHANEELSLKNQDETTFPETLRQVGSPLTSTPTKSRDSALLRSPSASPQSITTLAHLKRYQETHDDASDLQAVPTIKIAKSRSPPISIALPASSGSQPLNRDGDDFEQDFDLPVDGVPLKLSARRDIPGTFSPNTDDFDVEWAEGIGVRFGGTNRDGRSNPGSSVSALSPTVSSCLTEDDVDGLILPDGPLDLEESMKRRREAETNRDDFFADLEIGDGDVFNSAKLSLNQNIKRKTTARTSSPPRRSATTLTFTNKTVTGVTRIPRLTGHDRSHSNLEPVSESGAPISKFRRPHSRLTSHTSHTSLPNLPASNAASPPSTPPSASNRRTLGSTASREALRSEPTTTSAQLLKAKRSMPAMGNAQPFGSTFQQRPPSRADGTGRPASSLRPKTPVDRVTNDSRLGQSRRSQVPFLPAGPSQSQSHHINVKYSRHFRRHDSDGLGEILSSHRPMPRPHTPGHNHGEFGSEALAAAAKRTVTKPTRRRNFGDGTELESFDDLPTSASIESRFVQNPAGHGAPRSLRSKLCQNQGGSPSRTETPIPSSTTPLSPRDFTPRFARDTNASRIAREQRIASMAVNTKDRESGPLVPLNANWKTQTSSRGTGATAATKHKRGKAGAPGSRPHLIKPMGTGVHEAKVVKDMHYNPKAFRWEGNENSVAEFDALCSPRSPKVAPALITNVGAMQNVQVVGGMVFDPQQMCWLKLAPIQPGKSGMTMLRDDDDDVFADLDDLEDKTATSPGGRRIISNGSGHDAVISGDDRSGGESSDDSPITEEFDVGPEFIKRQRAEEEKWKRKVDKWVTNDRKQLGEGWRWAIRDLVNKTLLSEVSRLSS
ncbi:hypothetical protein Egran_03497, partial [Elaphomyces granulatus]